MPGWGHREAEDCAMEGELHATFNPLSCVLKQVTQEGYFGQEQKQDEQLKIC